MGNMAPNSFNALWLDSKDYEETACMVCACVFGWEEEVGMKKLLC